MRSSFITTIDHGSLPINCDCITVACRYNVMEYGDHLFQAYKVPVEERLHRALPKRRAEFLAGRVCAQEALLRAGFSECRVAIGEARSPVFPPPFLGSISHTNDSAVCTIASRARCIALGIDEELWIDHITASKIEGQILNKRERNLCTSLPIDFPQALTICFSAKETFFKAYHSHVGRYFGFEEAEVVHAALNGNQGILHLVPSTFLASYLPRSPRFDIRFSLAPDRVLTYHLFPKT